MKFTQYMNEASVIHTKIDILEKAYGEKYNTIPKFLSGLSDIHRSYCDKFFIDLTDKKAPMKMITKGNGDLVAYGLKNGKLQITGTYPVLKISDFTK